MTRYMLRKEDPWLASEEDVRGWEVQDRDGRVLGHVENVYFDPSARRVVSIVTASGREIPASSYHIGENAVLLDVAVFTERVTPPAGSNQETRVKLDAEPAPGSFTARFRDHFRSLYEKRGATSFAEHLPAYQFGRVQALEPKFYGRPFQQSEEDLRALFELHIHGASYDAAREAIRFGYELGAGAIPDMDTSILTQGEEGPPPYKSDRNQILPAAEQPDPEQVLGTSSTMAIPDIQSDPDRTSEKE